MVDKLKKTAPYTQGLTKDTFSYKTDTSNTKGLSMGMTNKIPEKREQTNGTTKQDSKKMVTLATQQDEYEPIPKKTISFKDEKLIGNGSFGYVY